jgi:hypothetical protein
MRCRWHSWFLTLVLGGVLAGRLQAQTAPVAAPSSAACSTQAYNPPCFGPPACAPYEDNNGPLLKGNPLLDEPSYAGPGWFAAVEVDVVGPSVKNQLLSSAALAPLGTQVHVQPASLDWTGAPRIDVGYRLAQGAGEFMVSYRNVFTSGSDTVLENTLHSRLNLNVIDLDYGGREYSLLPAWEMKWLAGIRLANVFFDAQSTSPTLEQRASNFFYGIGPHVRLDLGRHFEGTGLSFVARLDAAYLLLGQVSQSFEEAVTNPDGSRTGDAARETHNEPVPVLAMQAGLEWRPPGNPCLSFAAGYTFERWFAVGDVQLSHGEVTTQGVFLRAGYSY